MNNPIISIAATAVGIFVVVTLVFQMVLPLFNSINASFAGVLAR